MTFSELISRFSVKHFKYLLGCAGTLCLKIILTNLLISFDLSLGMSYLIVHVVTLLYSFFYHSRITFSLKKVNFGHFLKFVFAVIILKVADYLLVVKTSDWLGGLFDTDTQSFVGRTVISIMILVISGLIFVARYFLYKYVYRTPSEEQLRDNARYYTGAAQKVYCGYASQAEYRKNAASGGIVSACLIELLKTGQVEGCLVYKLQNQDGKFEVKPIIAVSEQDVLECQGSLYMYFPPISPEVLSLIREFSGRLAIVGLPCGISAFRKKCETDDALNNKIACTIGLFCGHTSNRKLLDTLLQKKGISQDSIEKFSFRKGLWRGRSQVLLNNGTTIEYPSWHYNLYQNLFVYSHRGCLNCGDHFAEKADISVGDVWMKEFKSKEVKHSAFAARTDKGANLVKTLQESQTITATEKDERFLFRANKRAAVFHKASKAKRLAGKFWKIHIASPPGARAARINEIFAALIFTGMYKWSVSKYAQWIFSVPRSILWFILVLAKLLTNF